jgi:ankyrin repeat protein
MSDSFWQAIQAGDEPAVRDLVASDTSLLRLKAANGHSAVRMACDCGHIELARWLIAHGAPVSAFDGCALGDGDTVRRSVGSDPGLLEAFSHDGASLLHLACFFGHEELARWLVGQGASVTLVSKNPLANTPLHAVLAGNGSHDLARLLVAEGADVAASGGQGITPLHVAAARGNQAIVEWLMECGAPITAMDDGRGPKDLAAERGFKELADLLDRN